MRDGASWRSSATSSACTLWLFYSLLAVFCLLARSFLSSVRAPTQQNPLARSQVHYISCVASTQVSNLNLLRLVYLVIVADTNREHDNAATISQNDSTWQAVDGDLQVHPVSMIHNLSQASSIKV